MSLFSFVQWQPLAACPLYWQQQNSGKLYSMSPWHHSGQKPYVQYTYEEINCFIDIEPSYSLSNSAYILGLVLFYFIKITFHILICSKLNYTAPAWQPQLSTTNICPLDCLQNCVLQLVTGKNQSYNTRRNRLIMRVWEKALPSSDDNLNVLP